ncbi:MAG: AAA family ATPase, partial [Gammaproteobacteria bacterium]|nr:AAA family ATPase [Gammaproteobacteria bacterium]
MTARDSIAQLSEQMGHSIIGQQTVIERLVIGLLANGNLLVEGLPGLAKTRAIKALAKNIEADFSRIQFTPDLLPADITGTEVYYSSGGSGEFRFEPG